MILAALLVAAAAYSAEPDLRLELVRHSLTGTHYRYRQYIDDLPVAGGEVTVTIANDGQRRETRNLGVPVRAQTDAGTIARLSTSVADSWVNVDGVARRASRLETSDGPLRTIRYLDPFTGEILREEQLFSRAKPARVFDPNPVTRLNDPNLQDRSDSDSAVPDAAYSDVEIDGIDTAVVRIVDTQNPAVPPADTSAPLTFRRSDSGFEDVNAVFHIEQSQKYLQSLGYNGPRAIASYPIEVDTHAASGADDSFFVASSVTGRGSIFFGEGGTDDAEDSDLVVHEYAHAIHEWIAPGTFLGATSSEARAISEGLGDYWALSASYAAAIASGRDPFCIADWDARCWEDPSSERCAYPAGSDCLRRVDGTKTTADFISTGIPGSEHLNGEIWSSALREIFVGLVARNGIERGRRISDTIVVESLFGTPPNPSFAGVATQMIAIDRYVNSGASGDLICAAMLARGILTTCGLPRGEWTLVQSEARGVAIPDDTLTGVELSTFVNDARAIESVAVSVNIKHPRRGELRLVLIAPDGTEVTLQNGSLDRSPDIVATYGRDAAPVDALSVLRGRSARGEWRLRVVDRAFLDVGTVLSWSLLIQFAGEEALSERPSNALRQIVPAVAHNPGANGTFFQTDVRLFNRTSLDETATLLFTPASTDGRSIFGAVKVSVPSGHVVALDDIVHSLFGTAGSGQLEILGNVLATSRTYTLSGSGTLGQSMKAASSELAVSIGDAPQIISRLENTPAFRSNVGFAETAGAPGTIRVRFAGGEELVPIPAFGHVQIAASGRGRFSADVSVVEGNAAVLAYGSIVDNRSGDSMTIPAARPSSTTLVRFAPATSAAGANGSFWRTTVWAAGGPVDVSYQDSATLRLEAGEVIEDVVATRFLQGGSRGVLRAVIPAGSLIGSRTWSANAGEYVPFGPASAGTRDLVGIESNARFRTNIGLIAAEPSRVRVILYDSAGVELDRSERAVGAGALDQFAVTTPVVNGRARIEVLEGSVYAYGSVVDQVTGDPSHLEAL